MNYKMVVMDMDDTLLKDDRTLSDENRVTIIEAQKRGIKVVLASGRPTYAMMGIAKELEMDKFDSHVISYNGAEIRECATNNTIFENSLTKEVAHELYDISRENNVHIHTYVDDVIITPALNKYTDIEAEITGMPMSRVENFKEKVKGNVIKVLMVEHPDYLKEVEKKLKPFVKDRLNMVISKPFFLEFMDKGIDKASALEKLINTLGIRREEIIAIGDSYNDRGMVNFAGLGVFMGNAPDDLKSDADYIADTNMNDGVAKVIKKFILNSL